MVSRVAGEQQQGPLAVGDLFLGKYEILEQLGQGGNACVYRARHRYLQHQVAIKVLFRDKGVSQEMLHRGIMEAQIQHKVVHPGITAAEDIGITDDGLLYIVMELMPGRSLRDVFIELGRLYVHEVLRLGAHIADALQAAHDLGVVHRDLKPDNIFITYGNQPKVFDFGIAKVHDANANLTGKNVVLGTILYISPEQLTTKRVTPCTDVYGLCVILFEALIGHPPAVLALGSRATDMREVARVIVFERPKRLDTLDPTIPAYVGALIAKGLANIAEQRFQTMGELANALRECDAMYESEGRAAGRELPWRDLSRAAKARSGVERVDKSRSNATDTHDTLPASRPFFIAGVPSGVLPRHGLIDGAATRERDADVLPTSPLGLSPIRREQPPVSARAKASSMLAPPSEGSGASRGGAANSAREQRVSMAPASYAEPKAPHSSTPTGASASFVANVSPVGLAIGGALLGLVLVGGFSLRHSMPRFRAPKPAVSIPLALPPAPVSSPTVDLPEPAPAPTPEAALPVPAPPVDPPVPAALPSPEVPKVRATKQAMSRPAPRDKMEERLRSLDEEMRKQRGAHPQPSASLPFVVPADD